MSNRKSIPILFAFLCMGFGDAIGPFVHLAKESFQISNFAAGFVAFAGFIMFFILSVPIGIYQDKKGKKFVLSLGLIIALIGLILPVIFGTKTFPLFLLTVLLLGAGAAIMQVAGNPVMRDVSSEGKYSRNLAFGQFIKAIGSLTGPLLPIVLALYFTKSWQSLFPIYVITILITIISLLITRIKEKEDSKSIAPVTFASCFRLFARSAFVRFAVIGIFVYVGAEVCMSSFLPEFVKIKFGISVEDMLTRLGFNLEVLENAGIGRGTFGVLGTGFFFVGLISGRLLGSLFLSWISPKIFLVFTSIVSIIGIIGLFLVGDQTAAFIIMTIIGFGFANVFPLIFSIAVDKMPERTNELSGLMISAIAGGAIIPPVMGALIDKSLTFAFIVPLICISYIFVFSLNLGRK